MGKLILFVVLFTGCATLDEGPMGAVGVRLPWYSKADTSEPQRLTDWRECRDRKGWTLNVLVPLADQLVMQRCMENKGYSYEPKWSDAR